MLSIGGVKAKYYLPVCVKSAMCEFLFCNNRDLAYTKSLKRIALNLVQNLLF